MISLRRIDVSLEVSQLSEYLAGPSIGNLHQTFHIVHYLKRHQSSWLSMHPIKIDIEFKGREDHSPEVIRKEMKAIYRNAIDEVPDNIPKARGKSEQNIYMDADHARNKVTDRSYTGILIFLNITPIF